MKSFTLIILVLSIFIITIVLDSVEGKSKIDPLEEEYKNFKPKATFYDEEYFNGSSTSIDLKDGEYCRNLVRRWKRRPLSVDTSGTCISVCEEDDCIGECVRVYPNNGDLKLSSVGMHKKISSIKSCF